MNNQLTEQFFDAAKAYPVMEKMMRRENNEYGDVNNIVNNNQTISPVVNCSFSINGSNLSAEEVAKEITKKIPEISKAVQNDIRKDLRKSGR